MRFTSRQVSDKIAREASLANQTWRGIVAEKDARIASLKAYLMWAELAIFVIVGLVCWPLLKIPFLPN